MNFYNQVRNRIDNSPFFDKFITLAKQGHSNIQYSHLNLSARALMIAHAWSKLDKNIIVITADDPLAEDYWDDLSVLIGRENAHYLPDFEVLPYEERSPHYSIRATRLETLSSIVINKPQVYTLSIRAMLRWLQPREILQKNITVLKKGMEFDPVVLISNLVGMGYEIDYQISNVYQAARRGGIVDIFSPPQQKPVRIEFFGDEIISLRYFSLATQRSDPHEIEEVTIIPAREISLHDIDVNSPLLNKVHEHGLFEGIENYVSLLLPEVQTFLDYFESDKTLIFWNDFPYVKDEELDLSEQVTDSYQRALKEKKRTFCPIPNQLFAFDKIFSKSLTVFQNMFVSQTEFLLNEFSQTFVAPINGIEGLNGDLNLLGSEIKRRYSDKQAVYIQFDNQSQSHRMEILLDEFEIAVNHYIGCLHQGLEIPDCGLAVYTDHEIFNRYKRKKFAPRFAPGEALIDYESLKPGDYIVHIDHGIGIFEGLKIVKVDGQDIECLCLKYAGDDRIYVPTFQLQLVSRYIAEEGVAPTIHKLGSSKWDNTKRRAKSQIELVAADILKLYAERSKRKGISH